MSNLNIKREIIIGCIIIIAFFGVFGGWAALAPLESAAIAPGTIAIYGKHKSIQHLEGGIVDTINVKENSLVKKGQVLLTLQKTQPEANLQITQYDLMKQMVIKARLEAELHNNKSMSLPKAVIDNKDNEKITAILSSQQSIFETNVKNMDEMLSIHHKRIQEVKEQLMGQEQRLSASKRQYKLIQKELVDVKILAEKRLVKQSRLLSLQREEARLEGQIGDDHATIDNNQRNIVEIELEIQSLINNRSKELLAELHETQQKIAELSEKHHAQTDVLSRTIIRAPISGRVVGLKVHTIGGVIAPGEVLMDIVPTNAQLIVEARVSPLDIDIVSPGLTAKVRVSVFRQRDVPLIIGKVTDVSADSFTDERTGDSYYLAQIDLPRSEIKKLPGGSLYPGMPVEVMIITQKLTPWQYFIAPISRSFNHAFREE